MKEETSGNILMEGLGDMVKKMWENYRQEAVLKVFLSPSPDKGPDDMRVFTKHLDCERAACTVP